MVAAVDSWRKDRSCDRYDSVSEMLDLLDKPGCGRFLVQVRKRLSTKHHILANEIKRGCAMSMLSSENLVSA